MNVASLQSQNLGQYLTLLSNPLFRNAVKTAAQNGNIDNKFDDLLKDLDSLSSLLAKNNESGSTESSSGIGALTGLSNVNNEQAQAEALMKAHDLMNKTLGDVVDDLIENADLMQSMMDLEVLPPEQELIELFMQFRDIISKLDKETRQLQKDTKDKETKVEYKLRPSSSTKSGFEEGLTLLAQ